jgi:hypothetical protein
MNYKLKEDEYLSSKKYVWKDGRCLGHIFSEVKERQDIDWSKYRQDKTLKMTVRDRLLTKYNAVSYPNEGCGQHDNIESAIYAIEEKQKEMYDDLVEFDLVTIDR